MVMAGETGVRLGEEDPFEREGRGGHFVCDHAQERVYLNETLGEYIPSFRYLVIPLSRYSNEELIGKKDEPFLVMLVDKPQSAADFRTLKDLPEGYLEEIARAALVEAILELLADKGSISEKPEGKIKEETDLEVLKKWLKQAARVSSVEEFVSGM